MLPAQNDRIALAFVSAVAKVEFGSVHTAQTDSGAMPYLVFSGDDDVSTPIHEFLPCGIPAREAMRVASSIAGRAPHFISPMGAGVRTELSLYEKAGYEFQTEWNLMARPISERSFILGDERAAIIDAEETETRVIAAMLDADESEHPTRGGFWADPAVRQRWVEDEGQPAAFGRLVIVGEYAYMGGVVTAPAFRRRGYAAAIVRTLLDDAIEAGANHCLLASTAMAHRLYLGFDFVDVMPLFGFRTPVD